MGFVQPAAGSSLSSSKITCFTCGEPGHKSTQCPNRDRKESNLLRQIKAEPKEPVKSIRRIRGRQSRDTILQMKVNSQVVPVLLDSGSSVTVVPGVMVAEAQKTGDTVAIKGYGAKKYIELPMAEIPFEVGGMSWVESVALAPKGEEFEEEGVVFGLDLLSERGFSLVKLANEGNPAIKSALVKWEKGELEAGAMVETLVKKEEEEGGEEVLETDGEEEEKPNRVRRLVVLSEEEVAKEVGGVTEVGGANEQMIPAASVVKGEGSQLEACTQVSSDFCSNLMPSPRTCSQSEKKMEQWQQIKQPDPQSRATGFIFVGGDVGTEAHRRMKNNVKGEGLRQEAGNSSPG